MGDLSGPGVGPIPGAPNIFDRSARIDLGSGAPAMAKGSAVAEGSAGLPPPRWRLSTSSKRAMISGLRLERASGAPAIGSFVGPIDELIEYGIGRTPIGDGAVA